MQRQLYVRMQQNQLQVVKRHARLSTIHGLGGVMLRLHSGLVTLLCCSGLAHAAEGDGTFELGRIEVKPSLSTPTSTQNGR